MKSGNRKLLQKTISVIVIVALLDMVGVSPIVMIFFTGVVLVVFLVSRRSQNRELERIFEFYVAADAILRDEERRWFGFEIVDVIKDGERALGVMPDSPPLHYFTLGALYHQLGNDEATVEYLSRLEDDLYDERQLNQPSVQLRSYVAMLREIEYNPTIAPQTLAAVRNLERARRRQATQLLTESRNYLKSIEKPAAVEHNRSPELSPIAVPEESPKSSSNNRYTMSPHRPIAEVLSDIYDGGDPGQ